MDWTGHSCKRRCILELSFFVSMSHSTSARTIFIEPRYSFPQGVESRRKFMEKISEEEISHAAMFQRSQAERPFDMLFISCKDVPVRKKFLRLELTHLTLELTG